MRRLRRSPLLATLPLSILALAAIASSPSVARACGGGVAEEGATIEVGDQLALYSVLDDGRTEVVIHLRIPDARADFGVILPVAGEPVLDGTSVEASELAQLEASTAPLITQESYDSGGSSDSGCGCGSDAEAGGDFGNGDDGGGVEELDEVDIGPITAVSIAADDPDALTAWLDENGFAIPADRASILDAYVAEGRNFIAFKRNDAVRPGRAAVSVHFTLPSDYRSYPLRMASVGAAEQLGVRVYVARPGGSGAGPSAPFEALTLDDLNKDTVRNGGYSSAVQEAIAARDGKAFLVEGVFGPETEWREELGERLQGFIAPQATLTRISAVLPRASLDTDVDFTAEIAAAPNQLDLDAASLRSPRSVPIRWGSVGLFFGAMATALVRRSQRRSPPQER